MNPDQLWDDNHIPGSIRIDASDRAIIHIAANLSVLYFFGQSLRGVIKMDDLTVYIERQEHLR